MYNVKGRTNSLLNCKNTMCKEMRTKVINLTNKIDVSKLDLFHLWKAIKYMNTVPTPTKKEVIVSNESIINFTERLIKVATHENVGVPTLIELKRLWRKTL